MSHKNNLDFLVIGAAKSATTTLHELLKDHPEIFIPSAKEVPFFSDNDVYEKGIDYYFKKFFSGATAGQKLGTVTPQYMINHGELSTRDIAQRIYANSPNVKIIAILRNPVERAYSHYKMQVQRGHEKRDFGEIIDEALESVGKHRKAPEVNKSYVHSGEYGRILSNYYDVFPERNILVLTTNELKDSPVETISKICNFVGISDSYLPNNPHKKSRVGGAKPKIKYLSPGFIYKIPYVKFIWKKYAPMPIRKRIEYSINLWNTKSGNSRLERSDPAYARLSRYFHDDTIVLEKVTHQKFPWSNAD